MTQNPIDDLRLDQYSGLLSNTVGDECKINIIDVDSASIIHLLARDQSNIDATLASGVSDKRGWSSVGNGIEIFAGSKTFLLLRILLTLGADEREYWLTVLSPTRVTADIKQDLMVKARMLKQLSGIIADDYMQNVTLDGMARELAIRYEELNVIYGMEDLSHSDVNKDVNETRALSRLIENCLDYLPVDLVAIIIPSENTMISNIDVDAGIKDAESILNLFSTNVLNKTKATGETLVVNRDIVTDWIDIETDMPVKFIVSPIFTQDNNISGIFVFANSLDKPNFTNSDRKLCDIFAIEVSNNLKSKRDELTGLLNRRGFENKINEAIHKANQKIAHHYLIHIDIDQFVIVNDTSGYSAGDKLLQQISSMLRSLVDETTVLGEPSVLARIGPDEFGILLENYSIREAELFSESVQKAMKEIQFFSSKKIYDLHLSIGIAEISDSVNNSSDSLKASQIACTTAKEMGGNRIRIYNASDKELMQHYNIINSGKQINEALQSNRFILYAQAIVPAVFSEDDNAHYEILIRMLDHNNNIIPPGMFIPAAERYKMAKNLDTWVFNKSIEALAMHNQMTGDNSIVLSINVSGQSIIDDRFKKHVANTVTRANVSPGQLCFEVTETAAIANLTEALSFIEILRELGCSFALDDFGSGMSSFNYLKHLPVDYLKIDGCFVKNILEQDMDAVMVDAINNIGHAMGLLTVAEFVENSDIQNALTEIGIDYLQGYGVHKPEPLHDILIRDIHGMTGSEYLLSEAAG